MNEKDFGKGGLPPVFDGRDYQWEEIGFGSAPFDWSVGYDVEKEVGKLVIKNQNGSYSCGGQAWAYYGHILDYATGEKSAKFIYAQTHAPNGGSTAQANCELVKKKGWAKESIAISYQNGIPPSESFMIAVNDLTTEAYTEALTDKALAYAQVQGTIDTYAQALRDNKGLILGITGQDNGTWLSPYPKPPQGGTGLWYHWIYCVGAMLINGKKYLKFANSWGETIGEKGYQYIGEEYIPWLFNAWTLVKDTPAPPTFSHNFTQHLSYGMSGSEVTALQTALKLESLFTVPATGFFGQITLNAVKKFQTKYGIPTTGYVGDLTNAKLNILF